MGSRYDVKCSFCGHHFNFDQGSTCWDYEEGQKELMTDALNGKLGVNFKKYAVKNPRGWIYRSSELFYCEKCNEYSNESYYELYSKKNLRGKRRLCLKSQHFCKKCGDEVYFIEGFDGIFKKERITCPSCGKIARVTQDLFFD